nr:unnamed protein product [Naegleria fowleri]
MRVFSKIFKSVRRGNDEDDTIIPYVNNNNNNNNNNTNNTSSSTNNNSSSSKKKKITSAITAHTSSSSKSTTNTSSSSSSNNLILNNIYGGQSGSGGDLNGHNDDDDTKSVDSSSNSNSIDYSKLNIEDVFDFEGIDSMCREAEDLNLIEFLTQEKIIQKLIEYVTCTHTEIPSYLEYKLSEATSCSNLQQETFGGDTPEDELGTRDDNNTHGSMRRLRSPTGDDDEDDEDDNNHENVHSGGASRSESELKIYQQEKQHYLRSSSSQQEQQQPTRSSIEEGDSIQSSSNNGTSTTTSNNLPFSDKREYLLQKLNYKYPFVATEILISTIGQFHILPLIMLPYSYQTDQGDGAINGQHSFTPRKASSHSILGNSIIENGHNNTSSSTTTNTTTITNTTNTSSSNNNNINISTNSTNHVPSRVDYNEDAQQQFNNGVTNLSTPSSVPSTHLQVTNKDMDPCLSISSSSSSFYNNHHRNMTSLNSRVALLNSELIRRKLFSFIYREKPLNAFQVKCFVRVIIAMMKIPHLTHLVMDYIYAPHDIQEFTSILNEKEEEETTRSIRNNFNSNNFNSNNSNSNNNFNNSNSNNSNNSNTTTSTHIILQMLKHIDSSDEISELLLMCLLYEDEDNDPTQTLLQTPPSGNLIQDSFLNILNQHDEVAMTKNLQVLKLKQEIIQQLCSLQCEQNFSRSVSFILTTIIQYRKPMTRKPPAIVQYILNRKQMELMIDNTLKITSNSPSFVDNMNFIMNLLFYIATNSQRLFSSQPPLQSSLSQSSWTNSQQTSITTFLNGTSSSTSSNIHHNNNNTNNTNNTNTNTTNTNTNTNNNSNNNSNTQQQTTHHSLNTANMILDESGIDWRLVLVLVVERISTFVSLLKDDRARDILKKDPTIIYVEQYHPMHALLIDRKKNRKINSSNSGGSNSSNSSSNNNNSNPIGGGGGNNSSSSNNSNSGSLGGGDGEETQESGSKSIEDLSFPPLGIYRLKIIELFVMLFKQLEVLSSIYDGFLKQHISTVSSSPPLVPPPLSSSSETSPSNHCTKSLSQIILESDVLEELIRLVFQYQSSLLHHMIVRLLLDIIEGLVDPFVDALFTKYKLADKLLQVHEMNQRLQKEQRTSLAISGFLTVMGQVIGDKQLSVLANNAKWLNFQQYASDRTFIERIYRVGSQEVQSLPAGEEKRLQELRLNWRERNI